LRSRIICSCILIFFLIPVVGSWAQAYAPGQVVEAGKTQQSICLGTCLMILEDNTGTMELAQVLKARDNGLFQPSPGAVPSFGYTDAAYWIYFTVRNNLTVAEDSMLEILDMDEIRLYIPSPQGGYTEKRAGQEVLHPDGFLKYGNILMKITLPPQATQTYFMRFKNQDPMILHVNLWSMEGYFMSNQVKQIFYGIYLGIMAAMILYNLFIFLTLRDISYLYYVLYIFSIGFYHLFSANIIQEYVMPLHPWLMDHLETLAIGFIFVWAIQFGRHYLLTWKNTPDMDKILRGGIVFGIALIFISLFFPFNLTMIIASIGILLLIGVILIAAIICLKKKYRPTIFYLSAWSIVALGAVCYVLRNFSVLPSFFLTDESILIGSMLEALLLAFGLAFRIDLLRREKEQATAYALENLRKADKFKHDYGQLFMLNPLGIALVDGKGNYVAVNPSYCRIYGYDNQEIIGENYIQLIIPAGERTKEKTRFSDLFKKQKQKKPFEVLEQQHVTKNGGAITIQCYRDYTTNEKEEVNGLLMCTVDITERKKQADRIKASLKEKEFLLKEIHHRVKNNLQLITSLINFKLRHMHEEKYRDFFKSIQNSIYSIALVHNKLYLSENLAKISFKEYIQNLVSHLFSVLKIDSNRIAIKTEVKDAHLGISLAIPCGLIINELVMNALKYAFPNKSGGTVKISFSRQKNHLEESKIHYILEIRDNGVGFPEGLDFHTAESFGLQLVTTLVEQLEGSIRRTGKKGVGFRIEFYSEDN
jgi:PAS domain S-box-containing protein